MGQAPLVFYTMIYPVKVFDKDGNFIKEVSSETLIKRLYPISKAHEARNKKRLYKASFRVYECRNCGVRCKSKHETALFCSTYCAGYWQKYVKTKERKTFMDGGLDDRPEAKAKLAKRVASMEVFTKGVYKPVTRGK